VSSKGLRLSNNISRPGALALSCSLTLSSARSLCQVLCVYVCSVCILIVRTGMSLALSRALSLAEQVERFCDDNCSLSTYKYAGTTFPPTSTLPYTLSAQEAAMLLCFSRDATRREILRLEVAAASTTSLGNELVSARWQQHEPEAKSEAEERAAGKAVAAAAAKQVEEAPEAARREEERQRRQLEELVAAEAAAAKQAEKAEEASRREGEQREEEERVRRAEEERQRLLEKMRRKQEAEVREREQASVSAAEAEAAAKQAEELTARREAEVTARREAEERAVAEEEKEKGDWKMKEHLQVHQAAMERGEWRHFLVDGRVKWVYSEHDDESRDSDDMDLWC